MDKHKLIARYPLLFHMAEAGSWQTILKHGLLSTTAALDRFGAVGGDRASLESCHRPDQVTLQSRERGEIVLRDQKPMTAQRLAPVLDDGLTPSQWYEIINAKVFFWARPERLERLLSASTYRHDEHDVFTLDTASLVNTHEQAIWLCHINSGSVIRAGARRGLNTFRRIADYPVNSKGSPIKEVAELVVDYSVCDIARHVVQVARMKGSQVVQKLFP